MQPQAVGLGNFADRAQRVHGCGGGGAGGGHDSAGLVAGSQVLLDGCLQGLRAQRVVFVGGDQANVVTPEAGQQRGLVHRAVGVGTDIHDQWLGFGLQATPHQSVIGGAFARADQRHQGAGRGGVLNHPAPLRRQAEHLAKPVQGRFFQFAQCWARLPRQPQYAKPGTQEVPQHGGQRPVRGKITVEIRVLPMGQARHDQLIHVLDNRVEGLALLRRGRRQGRLQVTGLDLGHDRTLMHGLAVIGDQVDQLMAILAKLFGGHARAPVVGASPPDGGQCAPAAGREQCRARRLREEPRLAHSCYGKCARPPCTPNCDWRHSSNTRFRNQRCSADACRRWCHTTQ